MCDVSCACNIVIFPQSLARMPRCDGAVVEHLKAPQFRVSSKIKVIHQGQRPSVKSVVFPKR